MLLFLITINYRQAKKTSVTVAAFFSCFLWCCENGFFCVFLQKEILFNIDKK